MTNNPFESLETKLHSLQSEVKCLREDIQRLLDTHSTPKLESERGIKLATQITGLAAGTLYNLISQRQIPHCKKGKRIYFDRQELQDWIKQGKRMTKDELRAER